MFFTQYTEDKINQINARPSKLEIVLDEFYFEDIFSNWVDKQLGINFDDACEAKDEGFTSQDFKKWVEEFKMHGGGDDFMNYVFDCDPKSGALESQRSASISTYKKAYLVSDFI